MAFSHGSNDAQKAMGIITLTLLSGGYIDTLDVPTWVKVACASAMALGTAAGGWRIISTMGTKIFQTRKHQRLCGRFELCHYDFYRYFLTLTGIDHTRCERLDYGGRDG